MKTLQAVLAIALMACAGPALAQSDPTPHQVYEAARSGHLAEAQQMVDQVLRDKPGSGEAHYVAAEIYAREGNVARARQELATAQELEPGLPFVKDRRAVQALESELNRASPRGPGFTVPLARPHASLPWGWILIGVAALGLLWMAIRRRAAASAYSQYPGGAVATGRRVTGQVQVTGRVRVMERRAWAPGSPGAWPAAWQSVPASSPEKSWRITSWIPIGPPVASSPPCPRRMSIPIPTWAATTSASRTPGPGTTAAEVAPSVVTAAAAGTTGLERPTLERPMSEDPRRRQRVAAVPF